MRPRHPPITPSPEHQIGHDSLLGGDDIPCCESATTLPLPPVMEIPELVEAILLEVERPADLLSMALVARRFKDVALRIAWTAPDLGGSPLVTMAPLFPEEERRQLLHQQDDSARIRLSAFSRFDYYAQFIRKLDVWHQEQEARVAKVMMGSRPDKPLFPSLHDLHVGASGEYVETIGIYLAPSLRSLRMNHWDLPEPQRVSPTDPVKNSLLNLCKLPDLFHLDLLDTRYPCYETDPDVVSALIKLASQLAYFHSYDFTTLPPVYRALSQSNKLKETFLDLCNTGNHHIPFEDVVTLLRDAFVSICGLGLLCEATQASELLRGIRRPLQKLDLRIESSLTPEGLRLITSSIFTDTPSLRSFRCSSLTLQESPNQSELSLKDALAPMKACVKLEELDISLTFTGEQMLNDEEITQLFHSWPRLRICCLESDPDGEAIPDEDEPINFGLTLNALVAAARFCPSLAELRLPFVDASSIPQIADPPHSKMLPPFSLHLGKCHVHDRASFRIFVDSLWPVPHITLDGCCQLPGV